VVVDGLAVDDLEELACPSLGLPTFVVATGLLDGGGKGTGDRLQERGLNIG
jgi:hypothetical protein